MDLYTFVDLLVVSLKFKINKTMYLFVYLSVCLSICLSYILNNDNYNNQQQQAKNEVQ